MQIRTQEDIQKYKESLGPYTVPDITECIVVKGKNVRVAGFYCPVIRVANVPKRFEYLAMKKLKTGRNVLIGGKYAYGYKIPTNLRNMSYKTNVLKIDRNKWLEDEVEESIKAQRDALLEKGEILLRPCLPEESTHISHYAISDGITRIDKIKRGYELCWGEELYNNEYKSWITYVNSVKNDSYYFRTVKY